MKKIISIVVSILMVLSLVLGVYAAGNAGKGNGKNKETAETSPSSDVTPAASATDTIEDLTEQLKVNQKDKAVRKVLHNKIKELRKQEGDTSIPVIVNGQLVEFDVKPVIKNNRTLIPVRAVSNALGATVVWDGENTVTVTKAVYSADTTVTEAVYSTVIIDLSTGEFLKDGVEMVLDVKAQVIKNRTFVPIRFLAEAFGMHVGWSDDLDGVVVDDEDEVTPSPSPTVTQTPEPVPTPSPTPTATPST